MTKAKDDREKSAETGEKFARIQTALQDPRCTRLMVSVLAALNEYADARRKAWPSFESLAFVTGAAIQNVKIAIKELEALGYITVDRDDKPGRSRVNYYHLQVPKCAAPIRALRDALKAHHNKVSEEKEACTRARICQRPPTEKEARARLKGARAVVLTVILACPDPSDPSLPCDPGSEPNGSADAAAPASRSRVWKGSEGEPLPSDFPDDGAMAEVYSRGCNLDLAAEREAFRRYHYSVHCLQRDWMQSWMIWIDDAIDGREAVA